LTFAVLVGIFIQADLYNKVSAFKGMKERAKTMRTAEQRFHAWDAASRMIPDHFFIGVGVNQFYKNTDKYSIQFSNRAKPVYEHSQENRSNDIGRLQARTGSFN